MVDIGERENGKNDKSPKTGLETRGERGGRAWIK